MNPCSQDAPDVKVTPLDPVRIPVGPMASPAPVALTRSRWLVGPLV